MNGRGSLLVRFGGTCASIALLATAAWIGGYFIVTPISREVQRRQIYACMGGELGNGEAKFHALVTPFLPQNITL